MITQDVKTVVLTMVNHMTGWCQLCTLGSIHPIADNRTANPAIQLDGHDTNITQYTARCQDISHISLRINGKALGCTPERARSMGCVRIAAFLQYRSAFTSSSQTVNDFCFQLDIVSTIRNGDRIGMPLSIVTKDRGDRSGITDAEGHRDNVSSDCLRYPKRRNYIISNNTSDWREMNTYFWRIFWCNDDLNLCLIGSAIVIRYCKAESQGDIF